jgi:mRNA interferase YafQ
MRKLVWDASFKRAFRQLARHDPTLPDRILEVLAALAANPFERALKTHKLRGQLAGSWACWVEYDCRIIFTFEADPSGGEDMIVLVDIGTHDEVY